MNRTTLWGAAIVLCWAIETTAFADPEVSLIHPDKAARPGSPYHIVLETTWTGAPDDYVVLPAEFDGIDWGTAELLRVDSFRRGETNVVSQTIAFVPESAGEFTTPEIKISFFDPEAATPTENKAPGTAPPVPSVYPTLGIKPFTLEVHPDRTLTWFSSGLGALVFLAFVTWLILRLVGRKTPSTSERETQHVDTATVQTVLHGARKHRLDGDYYAFYSDLSRAAQAIALHGDHPTLAATLSERVQHVGYGGERPTESEMDGDFREVERALTKIRQGEQL